VHRQGPEHRTLTLQSQGLADRKVLYFDTMHGAFGGFAEPRDAEKFQNRLKMYSTIWCCVNQHPGMTT